MYQLALMFLGRGLEIESILNQGKDLKKQAYAEAERKIMQSGALAASTQETLHNLEVEKYMARGSAKAAAASAGVAVGTKSSLTLLDRIEGIYRLKQRQVAEESGRQRSELEVEAQQLRKAGKRAEKASKRQAWASAIGGGYGMGKEMGWWGV